MKASLLASRDTELLAAVSAGLAGQGAIAAAMTGRVEETAALSDQLLRRAQDLDPRNPKWPAMRAQAYAQKAERSTGETRAQYIRKAMDEFDAAAAIDPAAVGDMPPSLFARTAIEAGQFAKARSSAERCLQQADASKTKDSLIHECTLHWAASRCARERSNAPAITCLHLLACKGRDLFLRSEHDARPGTTAERST